MDEELIRLLCSYNKQTSIIVIKNRNCRAPLLGLAKYIYFNTYSTPEVMRIEDMITQG